MSPQKQQKRQEVLNFFRKAVEQESLRYKKIDFGDTLDKNDRKRILFIIPEVEEDVFLCTALFKSLRERYPRPEWTFYAATKLEYKEILDGNPYVDKWIQYQPIMDNHIWLTGNDRHKGYFEVAYLANGHTQKLFDYYHSEGQDKIDLKLNG